MAGAMGGAALMGLGLAPRAPRPVRLVLTGDGELLMNLGALATIAVLNPANLSILVVDNGHYGETGYQKSHTSLGVDLERIAAGSGIKRTAVVENTADLADGAAAATGRERHRLCRAARETPNRRALNAISIRARCRVRFKMALAPGSLQATAR
jgi:thiamine pyrophosphate-dependent acetolactate synthase large subunit-like protein